MTYLSQVIHYTSLHGRTSYNGHVGNCAAITVHLRRCLSLDKFSLNADLKAFLESVASFQNTEVVDYEVSHNGSHCPNHEAAYPKGIKGELAANICVGVVGLHHYLVGS